jgi:ADP-ribose pyrophosphatase YjhB (NUDIX family)
MSNPSIQTLSFIFDNETDHILLHQIAEDGPLKRKHSGIKGNISLLEDMNEAAIRSIQEASGLEVSEAVLRGVVKTIDDESQTAVIYLVYESARFSGVLENKLSGRLKWVDILNIFNLQMESLVQEIMPNLLDGESFFEGTIHLSSQDEIVSSDIRICNTI